MKKKQLVSCLCGLLWLPIFAQNSSMMQFYRQNWQLVNPAAVDRLFFHRADLGVSYPSQIMVAFRGQQTGTKTTPATAFLSYEGKFSNAYQHGGQLFVDRIGAFSTVRLAGSVKFILNPDNNRRGYFWSIGIQPGVVFRSVDVSKLATEQAGDPLLDFYENPKFIVDGGLGVFLRHKNRNDAVWYAGLSTPAVFNLLKKNDEKTGPDPEKKRQVNLIGGRIMDLPGGILELSGWARAAKNTEFTTVTLLPFSIDGNARWFFAAPDGYADDAAESGSDGWWLGGGLGTNGLASVEFGHIGQTSTLNEAAQKLRLGLSGSFPVWGRGGIGVEISATVGLRRR